MFFRVSMDLKKENKTKIVSQRFDSLEFPIVFKLKSDLRKQGETFNYADTIE